jgi:hypothetical protein
MKNRSHSNLLTLGRSVRVLGVLVLALMCSSLAAHAAEPPKPKRVVCITADNSSFANNIEGWERQQAARRGAPQTIFIIGGKIEDCLANVADGDTLVLIVHGGQSDGSPNGTFTWNIDKDTKRTYDGFGGGLQPAPVPNGFANLKNVSVVFDSCYSCAFPGPPDNRTLCDKILSAMNKANGNGNSCIGFLGVAYGGVSPRLALKQGVKSTGQVKAALDCLTKDRTWASNPPANRPGANPNQVTAAQTIVDNCPGVNREVTVTGIGYGRPVETVKEDGKDVNKPARPCAEANKKDKEAPEQSPSSSAAPSDVCTDGSCECGGTMIFGPGDGTVQSGAPEPLMVGVPSSITVETTDSFIPEQEEMVEFSTAFGEVHFLNGSVSSDGRSTTLSTDAIGRATVQLLIWSPGVSMIQVRTGHRVLNIYVRATVP